MLNKINFKIIDWYMKTSVVKLFKSCKIEQWYDRIKLEEIQLLKLKELLIHSFEKSEYYNKLFKEYNFNPYKVENLFDIKILPILTKKNIRKNFNFFKSKDFKKYSPRITRTSGSTGEPLSIYHSGLSHSYLRALNFLAWNQAGYELGDKYVTFSGGSLSKDSIELKHRVYSFLLNQIQIPSYHLNPNYFNNYIEKIKKERVKYIYGYASALYDLVKESKIKNLNFNFIKGVFTTSDMLFKNQRELIEKFFGLKIIDIYGNPESGLISFECCEHNGYHYGMQNAYVEIVDEDGNLLEEGKVGRIIVTSLNNLCFPIIRYDTGDIGSISKENCKCGRGYIKIKNLGGRSRDYIVLKDGRHIHGAFFNHLSSIYTADWLDRYHIKQISLDKIIFQCLVNRKVNKDDLEKIKLEILKGLGKDISVEVEVVDYIPLTNMGKYKLISREFRDNE